MVFRPGREGYYNRNIDLISVERHVETPVAESGIPAIHWLAVEDHVTDEPTAESHLSQFRANGGFWYYGTGPNNDAALIRTFRTTAGYKPSPMPLRPGVLIAAA